MITASGQYLETLRRIALELGPQRSFPSVLRYLLHTLAERHPFLRPHLVIFDPETQALRLCLADIPPSAEGIVYEPGVGITGQVFTMGLPVIVERISENTVFQNKFFSRTTEEMQSLAFLSVPVLARNEELGDGFEVLGVLSTDTPVAPRQVLETHRHFLEVIAGIVAHQMGYWRQEEHRNHVESNVSVHGAVSSSSEAVLVSKALRHVLARITQAAHSPVSPLLRGEMGTGKAFFVELMHHVSPRRHMPLLTFNAAQPVGTWVEAELFGVQKGEQTQVLQTRKGIVERAHMGVLHVQNVDMLPLVLQRKLLCAMHEGEIWRVGGKGPVSINVRYVCSTRRTLEELRREGLMDPDMLLHFAAWTIGIPPLHERNEDILPLAEHFLRWEAEAQKKNIKGISQAAAELLLHYAWPGNAHEVKSCMQRAVAACQGDTLRPEHLPPSLQSVQEPKKEHLNFADAVSAFERDLLKDALRRTKGNMLEASRLLDASYRVIHYKVKKYALDPHEYAEK